MGQFIGDQFQIFAPAVIVAGSGDIIRVRTVSRALGGEILAPTGCPTSLVFRGMESPEQITDAIVWNRLAGRVPDNVTTFWKTYS